MSRLIPILTVTLLAFAATAEPVQQATVTLPLIRRYNLTSVHNLLRHDRTRAKALRSKSSSRATPLFQGRSVSDPVDNQAVDYIASAVIGEGPNATTYSLIVDTGSSNTWAGAGKTYVRTSTTKDTGDLVSVRYGSGFFAGGSLFLDSQYFGNKQPTGEELIDKVTLAPGLTIDQQSVGDAFFADGFNTGTDGILGLGPTDLTVGTLFFDQSASIPTVADNLYTTGVIPSNEFAVYFQPRVGTSTINGELTFGGPDRSKNTSEIKYTQVTNTLPAGDYWGINQTMTYGNTTILLSNKAGIVDTGTTLLLMATDAFDAYKNVTGAVPDSATGLLSITEAQYGNLKSLFFTINDSIHELNADGQLWPRSLNTAIGGNSSGIYLIVGDLGQNSGSGLDFINGYAFLERFYSVYDTTNNRVGFATTAYTNATTNFLNTTSSI